MNRWVRLGVAAALFVAGLTTTVVFGKTTPQVTRDANEDRVRVEASIASAGQIRPKAEQGDARSQYTIALLYEQIARAMGNNISLEIEFDPGSAWYRVEAARWYRAASEQGFAAAQARLGRLYASGEGVLADHVLAHMWFNIAGANGWKFYVPPDRDTLERDMTRAEITRATELARTCMASDYQDCQP